MSYKSLISQINLFEKKEFILQSNKYRKFTSNKVYKGKNFFQD